MRSGASGHGAGTLAPPALLWHHTSAEAGRHGHHRGRPVEWLAPCRGSTTSADRRRSGASGCTALAEVDRPGRYTPFVDPFR